MNCICHLFDPVIGIVIVKMGISDKNTDKVRTFAA